MADKVEMQDIRGLKVDKAVKGFALSEYIFKKYCTISTIKADHVRWYQETAADLTTTAPAAVANISPLSTFPTLEASWTRNTSYVRKFGVKDMISMEDVKSAEIPVLARTLLRLTRAVVKQVDTHIWDILTESQSPVNIQTFATTAVGGDQWDAASQAGNPVKDLLRAKKMIADYNYDVSNLVAFLSPLDYESVVDWIYNKGSNAPSVGSELVKSGKITEVSGIKLQISNNVTADKCAVCIPNKSCTYYSFQDTTSVTEQDAGIGSTIKVWELGIATLTDPKSVVLITDTQT